MEVQILLPELAAFYSGAVAVGSGAWL
jgi:hypothetical protein